MESFETYRSYLFAFAYRMLGSAMDAEDMVQETYMRYQTTPPEPIITADAPELANVEKRVDEEESISLAFLVLLEQLQPIERAVFLMREVFEYDYAEIATFLGKSEAACRQAFSRAKKHLAEDVILWADGGGKVKGAATRPIAGREAVARFSLGATRRFLPEGSRMDLAEVNRQPALIIRADDRAYLVLTIEVEAERIRTVRIVANPEKLAHI